MLREPDHSPYDLQFSILGFPIRISWTFWLMTIVLGYHLAQGIDMRFGAASPGVLPLLLIWAGCLVVSIVVHELGHAVAFGRCGIASTIVLYHFGGLAIPIGSSRVGRSIGRLDHREELVIAAAGPALQIGSALLLTLGVWWAGLRVAAFDMMPGDFSRWVDPYQGQPIESAVTFAAVNFYVWPSVMWGLLNLIPVLPLDGGRIAKALIAMFGGDLSQALWMSVIVAALMAYVGFTSGQMFIGIFFAWMAIDNYQSIQSSGWR